jgi:hypothetical protein
MLEPDLLSPGLMHYRALEMMVQPCELLVDLDFMLLVLALLGRLLPADQPVRGAREEARRRFQLLSRLDENSKNAARRLLHAKLQVPEGAREGAVARLVYLELFHHSSLVVHTELLFDSRKSLLDLDPAGIDEALASGLEIMGSGFVDYLVRLTRSALRAQPTFVFNELLVKNFFGDPGDLAHRMLLSIRQQASFQSYKLVGSMNIIGDPAGLLNKMGNGVVEVRICDRRRSLV